MRTSMNIGVQRAIDRGRRVYRGWWIVLSCYFAQMIASSASGWVFGILIAPMGAELGWTRSEIVIAITISALIGGLLAAPLGPLVDRTGPRVLMTVSLAVAGTMLIALSFVQEHWQYYVVWAVFGLASPGFVNLGPAVALANWFVRRRALAFMLFTFGSATAGIFLTRIAAWLEPQYGWRFVWVVMGVAVWMLVPLTWAAVRRRPEDVGLLPDGDTEPPAADEPTATPPVASTEPQWTAREALRTPTFWLLTLGFTLVGAPGSSIFVHMAPYVVSKGHTLAAGAAVASWYGIGVLGGRPVYGYLIAKLGVHWTLVVYAGSYGLVILAFLLPTGLYAIQATAVLLGIAIAGGQQLQGQAFPDYFGRAVVGTLSGYSGVAMTLARAGGPLFAAIAFDVAQSYVFPFAAFGMACLVAAVAFALAPPPRHPASSRKAARA
ncbi:MAG: MFS transporter [Chloroflexi bacterium]|nr:MFS transporter [Chloroflexota bacterium]